ncbi:hypothetical protein HDU87_003330 [Geranomyces variabilis]|uniref:Uncharacterized protein n=1 Tax=Geranomyces variabilis TaxID=109894 RepID=A0AAD5TJV3_9FUNG|nr:hypothetical protein HDU87_003330 [Geranomyces variabilis]
MSSKYDLNRHQGIKHGPFEQVIAGSNSGSANGAQQQLHQQQNQQPAPAQQQAQQPKKRKAPASAPATPAATATAPVRRSARNRRTSDHESGAAEQVDVREGAQQEPSPLAQQQRQQPDAKKARRAASLDGTAAVRLGNGVESPSPGGPVSPSPSAHYATRSSTGAVERKPAANGQQQQHQQQPRLAGSDASQFAMDAAAVGLLEGISVGQLKTQPQNGSPDGYRAAVSSADSSPTLNDGNHTALSATAQAVAYAAYLATNSAAARPAPFMATAAAAAGVGVGDVGGGLETQQQHPQNYEITAAALRSGKLSMQVDGDRVSIVRHAGLLPSDLSQAAYHALPQPAIPDCSALEMELARMHTQQQQMKSEHAGGSLLPAPVAPATAAALVAMTASAQEVTPPPSAHSSSRTSSLSSVILPEGPGSSNLSLPALMPSAGHTESETVASPSPQLNSDGTSVAADTNIAHEALATVTGSAAPFSESLSGDVLATMPPHATGTSSLSTSAEVASANATVTGAPLRPLETEEERRAIAVAMLLEIPGTMAQRSSSI